MKRLISTVLSAGILAAGFGMQSPSVADVEMNKRFKEFVLLQVMTPVSSDNTAIGHDFDVKLMETVRFNERTIPLGSTLHGKVTESREAKRWGRPARFKVMFDELKLPLKPDPISLSPSEPKDADDMEAIFLHDNRHTYNTLFSRQAIIAAGANVITIPLSLMLHQGLTGAWIMDDAVDAAFGAVAEARFKDPNDQRSTKRKVWDGALRGGTPIPLVAGMVRKGDTLEYEGDSSVYMRLPKDLWNAAFTQLAEAETPSESALQVKVEASAEAEPEVDSATLQSGKEMPEMPDVNIQSERLRN